MLRSLHGEYESSCAERTYQQRASLQTAFNRGSGGSTNHTEVVCIAKTAVAVLAVVLPMSIFLHVLIHVFLRPEGVAARVALIARLFVVKSVHVLLASTLGAKCTVAAIAFVHVDLMAGGLPGEWVSVMKLVIL